MEGQNEQTNDDLISKYSLQQTLEQAMETIISLGYILSHYKI
jgi:hypothetical protein